MVEGCLANVSCFCLRPKRGHLLIVLGFLSFQVSRVGWLREGCTQGMTQQDPRRAATHTPGRTDSRCAYATNPSINPARGRDPALSLGGVPDHRLKTFERHGLVGSL